MQLLLEIMAYSQLLTSFLLPVFLLMGSLVFLKLLRK